MYNVAVEGLPSVALDGELKVRLTVTYDVLLGSVIVDTLKVCEVVPVGKVKIPLVAV